MQRAALHVALLCTRRIMKNPFQQCCLWPLTVGELGVSVHKDLDLQPHFGVHDIEPVLHPLLHTVYGVQGHVAGAPRRWRGSCIYPQQLVARHDTVAALQRAVAGLLRQTIKLRDWECSLRRVLVQQC